MIKQTEKKTLYLIKILEQKLKFIKKTKYWLFFVQTEKFFPLLKGKTFLFSTYQSSMIKNKQKINRTFKSENCSKIKNEKSRKREKKT